MSQENVEIAEPAINAFNRRDVDSFAAFGAEDFEWFTPAVEDTRGVMCGDSAPESGWRSEALEANRPLEAAVGRYSTLAPVYERWAPVTESGAQQRVLELADVCDGENILGVAMGTCAQLVSLAQRNPSGRTIGVESADGTCRTTLVQRQCGAAAPAGIP